MSDYDNEEFEYTDNGAFTQCVPYHVCKGDNLESIARKFNVHMEFLKGFNPLIRSDCDLKEGMVISIPSI